MSAALNSSNKNDNYFLLVQNVHQGLGESLDHVNQSEIQSPVVISQHGHSMEEKESGLQEGRKGSQQH